MKETCNLSMHSRITTPQHLYFESLAEGGNYRFLDKKSIYYLINRLLAAKVINRSQKDQLHYYFRATNEGNNWLCWARNETIAEDIGLSNGVKVSENLRVIRDLGLVTTIDSPNCRRSEDYGVCTKILHARYNELLAMCTGCKAEARTGQNLQTKYRSFYKRILRMIEEDAYKPFRDYMMEQWEQAKAIVEAGSDTLTGHYQRAIDLLNEMFSTVGEQYGTAKTVSAHTDCGIPIQNTNLKPNSVSCNEERRSAKAEHFNSQDAAIRGKGAFEKEPVENLEPVNNQSIDLKTVLAACPAIHDFFPNYFRSWNDLLARRSDMARVLGVSESAVMAADRELSPDHATVALSIILQKHVQGDVSSPGGYLRGMVGKAQSGNLHLLKSLQGLIASRFKAEGA